MSKFTSILALVLLCVVMMINMDEAEAKESGIAGGVNRIFKRSPSRRSRSRRGSSRSRRSSRSHGSRRSRGSSSSRGSSAKKPTRVTEKCNGGRPIDSNDVTLELFEPYDYKYDYDLCSSRQSLRGPTKVVMHGFQSSGQSMKAFVEAYKGKNVNLIIVDWSGLAKIGRGRVYKTAATCALEVGKYLAKCLNNLNVNASSLHLFGHSLGAHGVGMAGRELARLGRKPSRVTGMDPAGPGFTRDSLADRVIGGDFRINLNRELRSMKIGKKSGDFVDIVHTNIGVFGAKPELGHVDYYVNGGGPSQPNCIKKAKFKGASHSYAVNVVVASLQDQPQYFGKCQTSRRNICDNAINGVVTKKFDVAKTRKDVKSGKYFLDTPDTEC